MPTGTPSGSPPSATFSYTQQNVIDPAQTVVDGCPVLPRLQCHEVQMGQDARLLWNFKNPQGLAVSLPDCAGVVAAPEVPFDSIGTPGCGVTLRMRELTGIDPGQDPIYEIAVTVINLASGLVRAAALPQEIVRSAGVYLEEWAVFSATGQMLFSNQCCTFVRRGLFGVGYGSVGYNAGPPTLEEIRLSMRDSSAADNTLLDSVEFDSAEIVQAVLRPIQYWNETPPPLLPLLTTRTFPFKEMWLLGIQAYLFDIAANHYRRNQLAYSAGGMSVDDKNKEQQYRAASNNMLQQFREMLRAKKLEINIGLFSGSATSVYSGLFHG